MRFGIIGSGVIGAYYGARFAQGGEDVHFLFHSDYDYVRQHGLTINSTAGDFHLDNVQAYHSTEDMPKCDVVIVALKSTNQHLLKSLLPPLLKEDTWVLLIQNGIGLEEDFVRDFPHTTVLAGLAFICSTKTKPGVVDHTDLGRLNIGDYNSRNPERLAALMETFRHAGVETEIVDYARARWQKAVWNMCFNGLTVVLDTPVNKLLECQSTAQLCRDLIEEVIEAATACGVSGIASDYADGILEMTEQMKPYSPSMKVDYDHHRPMEIYYLYTRPIEEARTHGYDMRRIRMLEQQLRFIAVLSRQEKIN